MAELVLVILLTCLSGESLCLCVFVHTLVWEGNMENLDEKEGQATSLVKIFVLVYFLLNI